MSKTKSRRGYGRVAFRRDCNLIPSDREAEFRTLLGEPLAEAWSTTWPALREIAADYVRDKVLVDGWVKIPEVRTALAELQQKFYDLARRVHDLDIVSMVHFADAMKKVGFSGGAYEFEGKLFDVYSALAVPIKELRAAPGRPRLTAVPAALAKLEKLFEDVTGAPFTWECHGKGAKREPISDGSRFVVAFFGAIDPAVTTRSIEHYRRQRRPRLAA